jgi:hypothetical protein
VSSRILNITSESRSGNRLHGASRYWEAGQLPTHAASHPFHIILTRFFYINFSIILPSTPKCSQWSLTFRFHDLNFVRTSLHPCACCILVPSYPPYRNDVWWNAKIKRIKTLTACYFVLMGAGGSPNVRDLASYPYEMSGKIIVSWVSSSETKVSLNYTTAIRTSFFILPFLFLPIFFLLAVGHLFHSCPFLALQHQLLPCKFFMLNDHNPL